MKIAMVAPPFGMNGGPEVVCLSLTQALIDLGVDVTLFAPADWKVPFPHVSTLETSLWAIPDFTNKPRYFRSNLKAASQIAVIPHADEFDLIHLHSGDYAYAIAQYINRPAILTLHSIIQESEFSLFQKGGLHTVAVSQSQKAHFPVEAVIWNGVPTKNIPFSLEPEPYLIFAGRLSEQKGVETAIEVAKRSGRPLLIFGRMGTSAERQENFKNNIAPHLNDQIRYIGEVDQKELFEHMRKASAFLFAIREPETFGLVVAEALASGTPIIGTTTSPLPELLPDKNVAFLSDDIDEMAEAARHTERFDRAACRRYAEEHFDRSVMAKNYLRFYKEVLKSEKKKGTLP